MVGSRLWMVFCGQFTNDGDGGATSCVEVVLAIVVVQVGWRRGGGTSDGGEMMRFRLMLVVDEVVLGWFRLWWDGVE